MCFNFSFRNKYPKVKANIGAALDKIAVQDPEFILSELIHISIEDVINKLEKVRYFNSFIFIVFTIFWYWEIFIGIKNIIVKPVRNIAASNIETSFNALSAKKAVPPQEIPDSKLVIIPITVSYTHLTLPTSDLV